MREVSTSDALSDFSGAWKAIRQQTWTPYTLRTLTHNVQALAKPGSQRVGDAQGAEAFDAHRAEGRELLMR